WSVACVGRLLLLVRLCRRELRAPHSQARLRVRYREGDPRSGTCRDRLRDAGPVQRPVPQGCRVTASAPSVLQGSVLVGGASLAATGEVVGTPRRRVWPRPRVTFTVRRRSPSRSWGGRIPAEGTPWPAGRPAQSAGRCDPDRGRSPAGSGRRVRGVPPPRRRRAPRPPCGWCRRRPPARTTAPTRR